MPMPSDVERLKSLKKSLRGGGLAVAMFGVFVIIAATTSKVQGPGGEVETTWHAPATAGQTVLALIGTYLIGIGLIKALAPRPLWVLFVAPGIAAVGLYMLAIAAWYFAGQVHIVTVWVQSIPISAEKIGPVAPFVIAFLGAVMVLAGISTARGYRQTAREWAEIKSRWDQGLGEEKMDELRAEVERIKQERREKRGRA